MNVKDHKRSLFVPFRDLHQHQQIETGMLLFQLRNSWQTAAKLTGCKTQQAVCNVKRQSALFVERLYVPNGANISASAAHLCFDKSTGTIPHHSVGKPLRSPQISISFLMLLSYTPILWSPRSDFAPYIHHGLLGMFQGIGGRMTWYLQMFGDIATESHQVDAWYGWCLRWIMTLYNMIPYDIISYINVRKGFLWNDPIVAQVAAPVWQCHDRSRLRPLSNSFGRAIDQDLGHFKSTASGSF